VNRSWTRAALAVGVLAVALAGCSKDSATAPSINPVGSWRGTTSQALPFTFQVTTAGLTSVTLQYKLTGSRCSYTADVSLGGPPMAITNNAITISSLSLGPGTTLNAAGTFTSSNASSGTFQISDTSCNGSTSGTWTATKS